MCSRVILCLFFVLVPFDKSYARKSEVNIMRDPFSDRGIPSDLHYFSLKLDHLDGEEAIKLLKHNTMLSEYGKVFFNRQSSMLIIYDEQANFLQMEKLIRQLDQKPQQVEITAHIVTINEECLSALAGKWDYKGGVSEVVKSVDTGLALVSPAMRLGMTVASVAGNLLNLQLAAFEAENQVEIIASPRLLTTHLMPASIRQGTEIPYEVASGKNGTSTIEFKQAVLGLKVTPRVLQDNYLELNLHISQNAVGQAIKRSEGGEALTIDTEEIKTQVIVKQGQTLILGGIFQQNHNRGKRQVPFVGKLPAIGYLFQQNQKKKQRRELVIFITPKIISEQLLVA